MMPLRTIDPAKLLRKRVVVRVDLDVDLSEGVVPLQHPRIQASVATLRVLHTAGARVTVLSHRGRPNGWETEESLKPIVQAIAGLFPEGTVRFVASHDADVLKRELHTLAPGDIAFVENVRFHKGEESSDDDCARLWAGLGEVFLFDAFAVAHRDQASVTGIAKHLKTYAGPHLQKELTALEPIMQATRHPFVALVGGAKLASKLPAIQALLRKADAVYVGGAIATACYAARGVFVGASVVAEEDVRLAGTVATHARLHLPEAFVFLNEHGEARTGTIGAIHPDERIVDVAPESVRAFQAVAREASLLLWNGPVGVIELPEGRSGTDAIVHVVAEVSRGKAYGVVGGGDTILIPYELGLNTLIDHISTGGGAMLHYVGEMPLPGLTMLV